MPKKVIHHLPSEHHPNPESHQPQEKLLPLTSRLNNIPFLGRLSLRIRILLLLVGVSLLGIFIYIFWDLPNPVNLSRNPAPASTKLLDRHGNLIYEIFADQRRTPIKLDSLPKHVWQATVAAEDKDFYKHSGFSPRGMARAFTKTFFRQNLQGGSTITQQLVKNALLTQERTLKRKIREFILSLEVEMLYSKDQILEFYLNQVPYGGTAYGLESAAMTYFGKSSKDLSLSEAALLAGLPQAPSFYSPFGSRPELAKDRQKYVLDQMLDNKYIDQAEYDQALAENIKYTRPDTLKAPHFSLWVKDLLIEKYGLQEVEEGGLVVTTTLDLELQNFAQDAIATEVAKLTREKVGNGAALVTHPKTGEILAMVGSKDYFNTEDDGNVNVVLAHRQPGSAIKPINYALAIDRKLITASTLLADKHTCFLSPNQKPYCPDNYDNSFHGATQTRFALANSYNIPAVKALVINGLADFITGASEFGLSTFKDPARYGPSITLGGGEVTMLDLAKAYGVLANSGQRVEYNPFVRIVDKWGKVLYEAPTKELSEDEVKSVNRHDLITIEDKKYSYQNPPNIRVISSGTAFIISHILYDNGARSATFGSSSFLNVKNHPEVSVKTGTTNDKKDNWTVGYTPDILVAVWVGNNDNSSMSRVASGVTGASPIWNKIITHALTDYPQNWPSPPGDVTGALVCTFTGQRAPENPDATTCPTRYEYFLKEAMPSSQVDSVRRDIPIYRPTQSLATAKQIVEEAGEVEYQNHLIVFDALGGQLCLDCPGGYGTTDNIKLDDKGKAIRN